MDRESAKTSNNSVAEEYELLTSQITDEKILEKIEDFDKSGDGYIPIEDFTKNKKVKNFFMKSTLGKGSFSKVKLATNSKTGEEVAIKIITRFDKNEKSSESYKKKEQRVYREAIISLLVSHPFIVPLKKFYYNEFYFLMVFERIKGGELLNVVSKDGPLPEERARKYFKQILSAIEYLHSNSIVHRDLKIENVLVDENDNIKMIDFGLSNFYDNKNNLKTFCGSLYFAAPELLTGIEYGGPEIDIWSLGIILYVMVCGKVPFDDPNIRKLHKKIKTADIIFPENISEPLKKLLGNIINVDPENRYGVAEILKDEWVNADFSSPFHSFSKKRNCEVNPKNSYIKLLGKVLKPQYPNFTTEIKNFSKICKNSKNRERFFWDNLPSISLYFLTAKNFNIENPSDDVIRKVKSFKDTGKYNIDECMYQLSKLLGNNRSEETHPEFIKLKLSDKESSSEDLSEKIGDKKSCIQDKNSCKHTQKSHKTLRRWLKKYLTNNNIGYEIQDKSYLCHIKSNGLKFKITIYCNTVLEKHFLSLTRLEGEKEEFNRTVKNINNMLVHNSKGKKGIKCHWNKIDIENQKSC